MPVIAGIDPNVETSAVPHEARREKLRYIQAARVLAMFLVVASHTRFLFDKNDAVWSPPAFLFMRSINLIFIFVSGFLFQYLSNRFHYSRYLETKFKNVVLPYLICSIPALAIYLTGVKDIADLGAPAFVDTKWEAFLFMIFTGAHLTPFWFIPVMVVYYVLSPLFLRIDRYPTAYLILLPLLAISFLVSRSEGDNSPLHNALFYAPVYLGGMMVSRFRERLIPSFGKAYPLLFLGFFLPLLFGMTERAPEGIYLFSKIIVCLAILGALYRWVGDLPQWIIRIGDMSFGVFFVHQYIISALEKVQSKLPWIAFEGIFAFLIACLLVSVVSLVVVLIVQKVAGRFSRQIIGA